jgi:hypothetical protein
VLRLTATWLVPVVVLSATCFAPVGVFGWAFGGQAAGWPSWAVLMGGTSVASAIVLFPVAILWVKWSSQATTPFVGYNTPRDATKCVICGYDLLGLPEGSACPECGRERPGLDNRPRAADTSRPASDHPT